MEKQLQVWAQDVGFCCHVVHGPCFCVSSTRCPGYDFEIYWSNVLEFTKMVKHKKAVITFILFKMVYPLCILIQWLD